MPFLPLFSIVCNTCYLLWSDVDGFNTTIKQSVSVIFTFANLVAYFIRFKTGLIITGIILLVSTLSFITLTVDSSSYSWFIYLGSVEISTPNINLLSFGIFLFYCIVNRIIIKETINKFVKWVNN